MSADRIIVALDTSTAADAIALAHGLRGRARWVKVGMTLFYAEGPLVVTALRALGFDVFIDLKLHDIPHQVRGAAASLAKLDAGIITVHCSGGAAMIESAVTGAREGAEAVGLEPPAVIGVTVLTSHDDAGLAELGLSRGAADQAELLARLAMGAGADGVVCSPHEAAAMRGIVGDGLVITPGVRPLGAEVGDQSRVATPAAALAAGASYIVVGRPITAAADPAAAFEAIAREVRATDE